MSSRESKRQKVMSRAKRKGESTGMMLTSLMDIFTVLVLYLLVNQSTGVTLEPPSWVVLPDSAVDTAPRESIVIALTQKDVLIQGQPVATLAEVEASPVADIDAIHKRILEIKDAAGKQAEQSGVSTEVTILADRSVPFKVLKKVMTSSANAGYGKISLAVNQK
jgi:biopolymer transport protein ExbD